MKFLLAILLFVGAALCSSWARSSLPVPRPVPLQQSNEPGSTDTPQQLFPFIEKYFPAAAPVFSMSFWQLGSTKAEQVGLYLQRVCTQARKLRLKQNFFPDITQLKLHLYSGENKATATIKDPSAVVNSQYFDSQKNVTIFVPGWQESGNSYDHSRTIGRGYLKRNNVNYIVADITKNIDNLVNWASLNVVYVARALSDVLFAISEKVPAERIHVVGVGLGANIAGIAGKHFSRSMHKKIGRITGLDPAIGCLYSGQVLDKSAATFVDIIHSSNGLMGNAASTGHVDFYPNGRVAEQLDCFSALCSHGMAAEFYGESVQPGYENHFLAVPCRYIEEDDVESCHGQQIAMGYATPANVSGIYYLQTNSKPPYGQNSA